MNRTYRFKLKQHQQQKKKKKKKITNTNSVGVIEPIVVRGPPPYYETMEIGKRREANNNKDKYDDEDDDYADDEFYEDDDDFEDEEEEEEEDVGAKRSVEDSPSSKRRISPLSSERYETTQSAGTSGFSRQESKYASNRRRTKNDDGDRRRMIGLTETKSSSSARRKNRLGEARLARVRLIAKRTRIGYESFRIFHLPPMKPYDRYLRSINAGRVRQSMTQTNDDARSVRTQTERAKSRSVMAQIPDDLGIVSTDESKSVDRRRLERFLLRAERRVERALIGSSPRVAADNDDDDVAWSLRSKTGIRHFGIVDASTVRSRHAKLLSGSKSADENVSDDGRTVVKGVQRWAAVAVAWGRPISDVVFRSDRVLVVHGPVANDAMALEDRVRFVVDTNDDDDAASRLESVLRAAKRQRRNSFIAVWSTRSIEIQRSPRYMMFASARITCCCASGPIVLCGTEEGSVVLWDLRVDGDLGKDALRRTVLADDLGVTLDRVRLPAASTDGLRDDRAHEYPIRRILVTSSSSSTTDAPITSIQFVSMDDRGGVVFWGIRYVEGSRRRLELNVSARLNASTRVTSDVGPSCFDMATQGSNVLIGMSNGRMIRTCRFGRAPAPIRYDRQSVLARSLSAPGVDVACVARCPFSSTHFLVGYADGDLSLYDANHAAALRTWPAPLGSDCEYSVRRIRWSPTRPGIFFVLFESGVLQTWDLVRNSQAPLQIDDVSVRVPNPLSFDVGGGDGRRRGGYLCIGGGGGCTMVVTLPNGLSLSGGDSRQADYLSTLHSLPLGCVPTFSSLASEGDRAVSK